MCIGPCPEKPTCVAPLGEFMTMVIVALLMLIIMVIFVVK